MTKVIKEQFEPFRPALRKEIQIGQGSGIMNDQVGVRTEDHIRKTKIDFPRFESGDPTEWLYKVNKYFEYHKVTEDSKLSLVVLYRDGPACI